MPERSGDVILVHGAGASRHRVLVAHHEARRRDLQLVGQHHLRPEGHGIDLGAHPPPEFILRRRLRARPAGIGEDDRLPEGTAQPAADLPHLVSQLPGEEPLFDHQVALALPLLRKHGAGAPVGQAVLRHQEIAHQQRLVQGQTGIEDPHGARHEESPTADRLEGRRVGSKGDLVR